MADKSYAKINLFLKVFDKKLNFHFLDTAIAFLDLHDEIDIKKSDKFSINISGKYAKLVSPEKNLFTEIIPYFQENFGIKDSVKINLKKNIPIGGGLGGGSSNAAKLIHYFNKEYDLKLSFARMQDISYQFGSDIAFFLQDKASIIKNRGDVISPVKKFDSVDVILIIPNFGLSTQTVFSNISKDYSKEIPLNEIKNKNFHELLNYGNDLFKSAINLKPELQDIYNFTKSIAGAKYVNMSGSGSTMFTLIEDGNVDKTLKKLQDKFSDYEILNSKISWERL